MQKIAIIAICNYIDSPTGGEVTFLNSILKSKQDPSREIALIGMSSSIKENVGEWSEKVIGDNSYKFLPVFKELRRKEETKIPYRLRIIWGLMRVRKLIKNENFDYIYIHCPELILGIGKKIIDRSKLIYHVHGEPSSTIRVSRFKIFKNMDLLSSIYIKIIDKCIEKSKKVIWVSKRGLEDYSKISRVNEIEKKSCIIENPYDSEIFIYDKNKEIHNNKTINFIFIGRLSKGKNVELAIRAINELKNPNLRFIICGDGEERKRLETLVSELGLMKQIEFKGNVKRDMLAEILQQTDIFLLTSLNEGSPVCVPEALAMGNIVISTDVGDVPCIIKDGFNGYIVKTFEIEDYAKAIKLAITNNIENMKENCIYSSKARSTKYISSMIYKNILETS